jgi:phosphoribosylaminoimidazole-succinocarboxamide synthase
MTSVKEFRVDSEPGDVELGRGSFVFTDDYSVFDWGTMPDEITGKGASLCTTGAYNFERLEELGVRTHYEGVVVDGETVSLDEVDEPPDEMAIRLARVPDLPHEGDDYDYGAYHDAVGPNYLIPLEVVFRNRVPVGSSLRSRTDPADHGLDGETWPDEPVDLDESIVEYSTKFEEQDRYLSREEADRIAGFVPIEKLDATARAVNRALSEAAETAGFVHQDGKIECLFYRGEVWVADVTGTFDENRFSYDGQQVSKEVLRQYHKRTQPAWIKAVGDAKARATREGVADWKSLCDRQPEPLDGGVLGVASDLYRAGANALTGREWFDAPSMADAVAAARDL